MKFFLFLLLTFPALAQAEEPTIFVDVDTAHYDIKALPKRAEVQYSGFTRAGNSDALDPEKRHKVFGKVNGLNRAIASFDELDRDILLLRARSANDVGELQKKYPKLPAEMLQRLLEESR